MQYPNSMGTILNISSFPVDASWGTLLIVTFCLVGNNQPDRKSRSEQYPQLASTGKEDVINTTRQKVTINTVPQLASAGKEGVINIVALPAPNRQEDTISIVALPAPNR